MSLTVVGGKSSHSRITADMTLPDTREIWPSAILRIKLSVHGGQDELHFAILRYMVPEAG